MKASSITNFELDLIIYTRAILLLHAFAHIFGAIIAKQLDNFEKALLLPNLYPCFL